MEKGDGLLASDLVKTIAAYTIDRMSMCTISLYFFACSVGHVSLKSWSYRTGIPTCVMMPNVVGFTIFLKPGTLGAAAHSDEP